MKHKLISWNVNGVRAALKNGLGEFIDDSNPDILCLQEVKAEQHQVDGETWPSDYHIYWNAAKRKGYSGVAILSKLKPNQVIYGMGIDEHDQEGRVLTLELDHYYMVNVYTPNAQSQLARLDYRVNHWDIAFRDFVSDLNNHKPVVLCGDLNVAHKEIDLANPKSNRKNPGFTDEERNRLTELLDAGFIDAFRYFEPGPHHYSWWSYRGQARAKNVGWRIDYFCVSEKLSKAMVSSSILPEVTGSDHCPVTLELKV